MRRVLLFGKSARGQRVITIVTSQNGKPNEDQEVDLREVISSCQKAGGAVSFQNLGTILAMEDIDLERTKIPNYHWMAGSAVIDLDSELEIFNQKGEPISSVEIEFHHHLHYEDAGISIGHGVHHSKHPGADTWLLDSTKYIVKVRSIRDATAAGSELSEVAA